jgi:hypothetical protein
MLGIWREATLASFVRDRRNQLRIAAIPERLIIASHSREETRALLPARVHRQRGLYRRMPGVQTARRERHDPEGYRA